MIEALAQNELDHLNILLVDDSAFARGVGRRVLQRAGLHSILEASNGQEAIDLLQRFGAAVDIVFCDLMMPDMDGIQIVRRVATLAAQPAFVFLSGANSALLTAAEDTARARGLRVLGAVQKPLTPDAVRQVLARLGDSPARTAAGRAALGIAPEELDRALATDLIQPFFQPKVSLADGSVAGFESLARWVEPDKSVIMPDDFIRVAERSGRIGALTERMVMLALKQCAYWAAGGLNTTVSVNLSAHMLVDLDLPDRMARAASRFGVEPRQLILEITESGLFRDTANALDILARLHMKGFPLSIDDFGTGYSSMEQLRRIPFAEMKIDRTFVSGAADNPKAMAILESSAHLGRSLQMSVVAEGAENLSDWNAVLAAGVDLVQGYYIARPMAADAVPCWMAARAGAKAP
jgi:EAL domain-containing protein (putative c-di-GMP-specific phosphodiesterase class I)/DNA-binding NarL/FixJ family response regulator